MDLRDVKNPDGSQRFHPSGLHPAHYRDRMILRKLEALRGRVFGPKELELEEAIAYHERKIAEVEAGEAEAKRCYIEAARRSGPLPPEQS